MNQLDASKLKTMLAAFKRDLNRFPSISTVALYSITAIVLYGIAAQNYPYVKKQVPTAPTTSVVVSQKFSTIPTEYSTISKKFMMPKITSPAHINKAPPEPVVIVKSTAPPKANPSLDLPTNQTGFKSWMPRSALTCPSSSEYKLLAHYTTDNQGLCRVGNYYCVAIGTYYTSTVGDLFRIKLSGGRTFDIIVADIKSTRDTDAKHQYTRANGCMTEFIVNTHSSGWHANSARRSGSISTAGFQGTLTSIEKIGHYDF